MKKVFSLLMLPLFGAMLISLITPVNAGWNFGNPVEIVDEIRHNANKDRTNTIQKTDLDPVTSTACKDFGLSGLYPITKTLCFLKNSIWDYLQYAVYIWLVAATIFLIRNAFQIVTAPDKEKQMGIFKKNLKYIIIGVVLLTAFYYIIDIFASVINLVTG